MDTEILYSDCYIAVCVKPAGILSTADRLEDDSLRKVLAKKLDVNEVYCVHRLDKEVSGIMVYALNKVAAATLSKDIGDHTRFVKEYIAKVSGTYENTHETFEDLLFKDSVKNKSYVVKRERKGVKKAKADFTLLKTNGQSSIVKMRLFTGRTHQIRVQLASRKMPIYGDRKYGGKEYSCLALCAYKLSFYHPKTNEFLCFEKEINQNIFFI